MCSTVEGVKYSGGYSVQWRDIISTVEEYHKYDGGFSVLTVLYWWYPSAVLNILQCTDDIPPLYWWYHSTVLMISLNCTDYPPPHWRYPPIVLNILHCTDDILHRTDDIPPLYWISSTALHTLHSALQCSFWQVRTASFSKSSSLDNNYKSGCWFCCCCNNKSFQTEYRL